MRFEDALRLAGLRPREVLADGRWRRCATEDKPGKRNGAYKLSLGGGRGWYRNWATDTSIQVWDDDREHEVRPVDQERMRVARERERASRIHSMQLARGYWNRAKPLNQMHPYIANKGLSALGCTGLRASSGLLVVPVWHGEWVISVQTINEKGEKLFWTGAPVKGGAYVLDRPRHALTAVCEGLATGLAIFQSVRTARVIVAFDSGNLLPVVQRMRPSGSVVMVADNDHGTMAKRGFNPGIDAAKNAADLIGCGVVWPEGIEGTDVADALREWGQGANKRVERLILSGLKYVAAEAPS